MSDITQQPYAEWLENALHDLVELQPKSIGIITIMPDGSTGTHYWDADNRDRLIMIEAITIDYLDALIRVNAEYFREMLMGDEEDDDDEDVE